jgi:hypothetical protein
MNHALPGWEDVAQGCIDWIATLEALPAGVERSRATASAMNEPQGPFGPLFRSSGSRREVLQ